MKKEKIRDRELATNSVPMAVIFRLDRKIQILSLDSPIKSGNDGIKKTSQKDLERFL
jgi:hypothetical protein